MAFLNRQSEVVEEVPELEHYYAQRRTSNFWGWVMAAITILLTVLIIIGLFYGGRWVYRELNDSQVDEPTVTAPVNSPTPQSTENKEVATLPAGESNDSNSASQPTTGTPVTSSTNATARTPSQIAKSGPGETMLIAISSATLAYVASLYYFSRQHS
jgi:cytoskeletal protein RodZ